MAEIGDLMERPASLVEAAEDAQGVVGGHPELGQGRREGGAR